MCPANIGGESFGVVPLEGMAAGCALVHSDIAAFLEMTSGAGVAFRTGDHNALADALVRLLGDRGQLRATQERCRRRAWDYDWQEIAREYADQLTGAVKSHGS